MAPQFLGVFWNSVSTIQSVDFGQSPFDPGATMSAIPGTNDEPYSDRAIACVAQGRAYVPLAINDALELSSTKAIDMSVAAPATAVNGYRLVQRASSTMTPEARDAYTHTCSVLATTLDTLLDQCTLLGYNVTRDKLRVVPGVANASSMYAIGNSLPVLFLPLWDNALSGRFVVPGSDGSACMVRPAGKYIDAASATPTMVAVPRSGREPKTLEWLQRSGGAWRNGWYEALDGTKWFSDVLSNEDGDAALDAIRVERFNMRTGERLDCTQPRSECEFVITDTWGATFTSATRVLSTTSIVIANGERFGFFQYRAQLRNTVTSVYDWEAIVSSAYAIQLLQRWLFAMLALARGFARGTSSSPTTGIGCLANCPSFTWLPLLLLPRLKTTLFAFWTAGCVLEGQQRALSEAWFIMYPAIVEVVLLYYSLLNLLAKVLHQRVSDALFGPSVLFFCALHWLREHWSTMQWLGVPDRSPALIAASEFADVALLDFFSTDLALRVNGGVAALVRIKFIVLAASLLPFVRSCYDTWSRRSIGIVSHGEHALASRVRNAGGLCRWQSPVRGSTRRVASAAESGDSAAATAPSATSSSASAVELDSYELVRLGYVVFGDLASSSGNDCDGDRETDAFVLTLDDWDLLTLMKPLRRVTHLWNHRVTAFALRASHRQRSSGAVAPAASMADQPELLHIDHERLQRISWWRISAHSIE